MPCVLLTLSLPSSATSLNFASVFDATSVGAADADAKDVADSTVESFSSTADAALCLTRLSMAYADRYLSLMWILGWASVDVAVDVGMELEVDIEVDVDVDGTLVVMADARVFLARASDILLALAESRSKYFEDAVLIRLFLVCTRDWYLFHSDGYCSLRGTRAMSSSSAVAVGAAVVDTVGEIVWLGLEVAPSQLGIHHAPASLLILVVVVGGVRTEVCTVSWSVVEDIDSKLDIGVAIGVPSRLPNCASTSDGEGIEGRFSSMNLTRFSLAVVALEVGTDANGVTV